MEYWTKSGIMPCHAMSYHTTSGSPCERYLDRFVRSDHGKGIAAREGNGREGKGMEGNGREGERWTQRNSSFDSIPFHSVQCNLIQVNAI